MAIARIIGKILIDNSLVIQSKFFSQYLPVGRSDIVAKFLDDWGIDELLVTVRGKETRVGLDSLLQQVERVSGSCNTPITAGGGIYSLKDALDVIRHGADRIAVNSLCIDDLDEVKRISDVLGVQALVGVVDFKKIGTEYFVYDYRQKQTTGIKVQVYVDRLVQSGIGEVMLHSVDRDGSKDGYEIELYALMREKISIPIIASGGFAGYHHAKSALQVGADAIAIGNALFFSEHPVAVLKNKLGSQVCRSSNIDYSNIKTSEDLRQVMPEPDYLDDLLYKKRERKCI